MNDIHSFKCSEDQTLAENLEFDADLKITEMAKSHNKKSR